MSMRSRDLVVLRRNGVLVHVQREPLEMARVALGPSLTESIFVHPRYVPASVPFELVKLTGRVVGRTVDVFTDEPILVGSTVLSALNFKGVGADTPEIDLLIDPKQTFDAGRSPRSSATERIWGALLTREVYTETVLPDLSSNGIPFSPTLGSNHLPAQIINLITSGQSVRLSQVVRGLLGTNIRMNELPLVPSSERLDLLDHVVLAQIDAKIVSIVIRRFAYGSAILSTSRMDENRYCDGTLTDASNYSIYVEPNRNLRLTMAVSFPTELISSAACALGPSLGPFYLAALSEQTGIDFSSVYPYFRGSLTLDDQFNISRTIRSLLSEFLSTVDSI
ncbi:hypothetical protein HY990_04110 [Candidatus Micrarchaeota archaeon]|nr:hypothetical protein [Candidatus Micrarchaeota archaeon]